MLEKEILELQNNDHLFKELNSLCGYLAMFPLHISEEYIKKYTKEGDIVYDPFSGRGTTAFAAIKNNRISYSNDLSDLAFVLTRAKSFPLKTKKLIDRVKQLEEEYRNYEKENYKTSDNEIFNNINVLYSEKNSIKYYSLEKDSVRGIKIYQK